MKTIPFLALLAMLTLASSYVSAVMATPPVEKSMHNGFDYFRIHRQGHAVALSWSVHDVTVSHFLIERSHDGATFTAIWEMPCNGTAPYKYIDEGVYGGTYHYRITAVTATEGIVQSAVAQVRLVRRK